LSTHRFALEIPSRSRRPNSPPLLLLRLRPLRPLELQLGRLQRKGKIRPSALSNTCAFSAPCLSDNSQPAHAVPHKQTSMRASLKRPRAAATFTEVIAYEESVVYELRRSARPATSLRRTRKLKRPPSWRRGTGPRAEGWHVTGRHVTYFCSKMSISVSSSLR
jgi:hypothetical protein